LGPQTSSSSFDGLVTPYRNKRAKARFVVDESSSEEEKEENDNAAAESISRDAEAPDQTCPAADSSGRSGSGVDARLAPDQDATSPAEKGTKRASADAPAATSRGCGFTQRLCNGQSEGSAMKAPLAEANSAAQRTMFEIGAEAADAPMSDNSEVDVPLMRRKAERRSSMRRDPLQAAASLSCRKGKLAGQRGGAAGQPPMINSRSGISRAPYTGAAQPQPEQQQTLGWEAVAMSETGQAERASAPRSRLDEALAASQRVVTDSARSGKSRGVGTSDDCDYVDADEGDGVDDEDDIDIDITATSSISSDETPSMRRMEIQEEGAIEK
jgi:hypothetical protein